MILIFIEKQILNIKKIPYKKITIKKKILKKKKKKKKTI
jgi:hypothetical protein